MVAADLFTLRRLAKFVESFRSRRGQLPTLSDLEKEGYERSTVDAAVKKKLIQGLYVTMTTGAVVKGYQIVKD